MERIPELILLPLSNSEALLILDALASERLHLRGIGTPDALAETYDRVTAKILKLMDELGQRPREITRENLRSEEVKISSTNSHRAEILVFEVESAASRKNSGGE